MTGRVDPAETLAYVDDCLDPEARSEFEARLKADPELRREVARWEAQNRAIRAVFGAPPRGALDLGGASNENGARRAGEAAGPADGAARSFGQARKRRAAARPIARPRPAGPGPTARRLAGAVALAAAIVWVGLPSLGPRPPAALLAAGAAAARALADLPVEFVAGDPAALAQRLGPRLALAPPLAPGLRLVGARLAPGSQATATLYLYDNSRGERVALMVEPLDEIVAAAPRRGEADGLSVAAWTGAGYGFVAAARADADVAALIAAAGADDQSLADAGAQRR
ncbi:anti-sigma factor family protein [Rhodoblastus sp.]|uniref:anti-sigma factor family protein n=1 Tax=Rhodoblastus sp. TaxID=1962975 RepID=UPI003F993D53